MEDGSEMQMMSMSMSGSTSNFSGVGSTVDLEVGVGGGDEVVFDIRRASNSTRMSAGVATGGKPRVRNYPLDPFDAVLLDQYVFTVFYCYLNFLNFCLDQ